MSSEIPFAFLICMWLLLNADLVIYLGFLTEGNLTTGVNYSFQGKNKIIDHYTKPFYELSL